MSFSFSQRCTNTEPKGKYAVFIRRVAAIGLEFVLLGCKPCGRWAGRSSVLQQRFRSSRYDSQTAHLTQGRKHVQWHMVGWYHIRSAGPEFNPQCVQFAISFSVLFWNQSIKNSIRHPDSSFSVKHWWFRFSLAPAGLSKHLQHKNAPPAQAGATNT